MAATSPALSWQRPDSNGEKVGIGRVPLVSLKVLDANGVGTISNIISALVGRRQRQDLQHPRRQLTVARRSTELTRPDLNDCGQRKKHACSVRSFARLRSEA
jgi:hypothetical protein